MEKGGKVRPPSACKNYFKPLKCFSTKITRPNIMSRCKNSNILHFHHRRYHIFYSSCSRWKRLLHITSSLSPSNNNQLGRKIIKIISKQKRNVSCVFSLLHTNVFRSCFFILQHTQQQKIHIQ